MILKITLGSIRGSIEAFQSLSNKELPTKTAYWVGRFMTKLVKEHEGFEKQRIVLCKQFCRKDEKDEPIMIGGQDQYDIDDQVAFRKDMEEQLKIISEKHCKRDDEGNPIMIPNPGQQQFDIEDMEAFNTELENLAEIEIDFEFKPLTVDQLGDAKMKPRDLLGLGDFITDEGE